MPTNDRQTTVVREYMLVIKRRAWIVVAAIAVAVAAALLMAALTTPRYLSSATLVFQKQSDIATVLAGTQYVTPTDIDRELNTSAQLITGRTVAALADERLTEEGEAGGDVSVGVSAIAVEDTNAIVIDATSTNAKVAALTANAYAKAFVEYKQKQTVDQLRAAEAAILERMKAYDTPLERQGVDYAQLVGTLQDIRVLAGTATANYRQAELAVPADSPYTPKPVRDAVLALVIGLVGGIAIAFLVEQLDVRVHSVDEIGEALGLPVLARVPRIGGNGGGDSGPVTLSDPIGPNAEAYRIFRGNLEFADIDGGVRTLMVTSAVQGEGKSTTAANLAVAAALGGKRVILVDADLRRASMHRLFGFKNNLGLSSVLTGRATLAESLHRVHLPGGDEAEPGVKRGLAVLTSGPLPPNPGEIAASQRLADFVASLTGLADLVLVDAPPFLVVGDAGALSRAVDGVVVVARLGVLTRAMAQDSRALLATLPCRVLGLAVVGIPTESAAYRYKYYSKHADETGDEAVPDAPSVAPPVA